MQTCVCEATGRGCLLVLFFTCLFWFSSSWGVLTQNSMLATRVRNIRTTDKSDCVSRDCQFSDKWHGLFFPFRFFFLGILTRRTVLSPDCQFSDEWHGFFFIRTFFLSRNIDTSDCPRDCQFWDKQHVWFFHAKLFFSRNKKILTPRTVPGLWVFRTKKWMTRELFFSEYWHVLLSPDCQLSEKWHKVVFFPFGTFLFSRNIDTSDCRRAIH